MKLYHFPFSPNSRKVVAVLHQLHLDCELAFLDLAKGEQLKPDFIKLNPNHAIPTLVDGDFTLWESNAIMIYLCAKAPGNTLYSADPRIQADINRWLFWQTAHFGRACGIMIFENVIQPQFMKQEPDPAEIAKGEESFHRFAEVLENYLKGREWLVGNDLTLADLSVGSFLALAEMAHYPMKPYQEIPRWYGQIEQLPAWQSSADPK
jgi:glutathione S-transferase